MVSDLVDLYVGGRSRSLAVRRQPLMDVEILSRIIIRYILDIEFIDAI